MKSVSTIFILVMFVLIFTFTTACAQPGIGQVWAKYEGNPVFNLVEGPGSSWNTEATHFAMNVGHVLWDDTEYKFYTGGYDGDNYSIGMATSLNIDSGWTYYDQNPVFLPGTSGTWDDYSVGSPCVIKDGATYRMWYLGSPNANVNWKIGYATSLDGITWERHPNPVLEFVPGTWENSSLSSMYVIKDGDTLRMWYADEGLDVSGLGYASSVDGITWDKSDNNPVLRPGTSGQWDDGFVTVPLVLFESGKYRMWYSGAPDTQNDYPWHTGFAISDDGINWTKDFENNPVLPVGAAGQWDEYWAGSYNIFKINDSTYNMLYLGSDFQEYQFGLATISEMGSDTIVNAIEKDYLTIPSNFALGQNYPNPFNPTTTIEFQIPNSEFVTLEIYNILGEKVATLLSAFLLSGSHQYTWNAAEFSSGIYYYQLVAGDYKEVKKMILIK
jgi:predicted GH43/DUF377 family glycosyl hydrolase